MKKRLLAILLIFSFLLPGCSLFTPSIIPAQLIVQEGIVQVDQGKGFATISDSMELDLNDKIKTLQGIAKVILYESIIITIEPESEVSIKDLTKDYPKIKQSSGVTWTKFSNILGLKSFDVETPTTVATVRGTEFIVDLNNNKILLLEGKIDLKSTETNKEVSLTDFEKSDLTTLEKENMSPEEKTEALPKLENTLDNLKELRNREVFKNQKILSLVQKKYDFTDEDVLNYLDEIDQGKLNDKELAEKSPIKIDSIDKVLKMDDEIKKQQKLIEELKNV